MPVSLTEKEFSQHLDTIFRVKRDGGEAIDFTLVEVKPYTSSDNEQGGMERFSIFFRGPSQPYLPQSTYSLDHDQMGQFEIFLVPIGRDDENFLYEAVFNYSK